MTDAREAPTPPSYRWATESDCGAGLLIHDDGAIMGTIAVGHYYGKWMAGLSSFRPAVIAEPPDLQAVAEERDVRPAEGHLYSLSDNAAPMSCETGNMIQTVTSMRCGRRTGRSEMSDLSLKTLGPNVKALAIMRASVIAIPSGSGFEAGVQTILEGRLGDTIKQGIEWAHEAIRIVKTSPDNPFGDDDEAIAGYLVAKAKEKAGNANMICVIVNDGTVNSGLLHIPAAPNLDEMLTLCGWSDLNGSNEVEGIPTCEDCKKALWHYKCLSVEP